MKPNLIHRLLLAALLASGGARAATITNTDPAPGAGVGYAHTVIMDREDSGSLSNHVGAWSWEDNALFDVGAGDPPVGWTHTSRWVALKLEKDTVLTVAMERDATVPWPSGAEPDRLADTSSMFPSFTLWRNWQNTGSDSHTYNNRGPVSWAPDLEYLDHLDNSTQESVTRSIFLPAGEYSLALGSNAPANNTNRQGFKVTFTTQGHRALDPVPVAGGIGYSHTLALSPGEGGHFSNHTGAWSWEDNALFNEAAGDPPVGWTHTSRWVALNLDQEAYFTITVERDATVPWPSGADPGRLADTSSMFPSFTLWRNWKNTGGDNHTYNNRGPIAWAPELEHISHRDNSTKEKVTQTWCLPAGQYSLVVGSNAPANNTLRQGFKLTYAATGISQIINGDPFPGGVGYAHIISAGLDESGALKNHVGAWSWEDNALFGAGDPPVGWTHTSRWVALHVKEPLAFQVSMSRDATVPWPSGADPDRLADTSSMFPSLTLWRGWHNEGGDSHTYNNRGSVAWADQLHYMDHIDNSTQTSITRTWNLPAGYYTFALGSNAPANNTLRQGFLFEFETSAPAAGELPAITMQPKSLDLLQGKSGKLTARARGPGLEYQWFRNGMDIPGATGPVLNLNDVTPAAHAGEYRLRVRNSLGSAWSDIAHVTVLAPPVISPVDNADLHIGQWVSIPLHVTGLVESYQARNLPRGLVIDPASRAITGVPLQKKDHFVSITPRNKAGYGNTIEFLLIVLPAAPLPPAALTGILPPSEQINGNLGGILRLQINSGGGFSGSLRLGSQPPVPFTGEFDGHAAALEVAGGTLEILRNPDTGGGTASFTKDGHTLEFDLARPIINLDDLVVGNYTAAFAPAGDFPAGTPEGYSVCGFQLTALGLARGVFILADGVKLTFSSPMAQDRSISVLGLLYNGHGAFSARLPFHATDPRFVGATATWYKAPLPANSSTRFYRDGFGPLPLEGFGGQYLNPSPGETVFLAPPRGLNAELEFSGSPLDTAFMMPGSILTLPAGSPARGVFPAPNATRTTLTVTPGRGTGFTSGSTGSFRGTANLVDFNPVTLRTITRRLQFFGMIVDDGASRKGCGYFLLPALPEIPGQTPANTPIESGSVLLHEAEL